MKIKETSTFFVKYPRRRLSRGLLRLLVRTLLFLFARLRINGLEHLPESGPFILAGNHVGIMEVVLMAFCTPFQVEFLGSGDIPLDPNFAWMASLYGFIPVKRGNLDREAMQKAEDILAQGGVVGIFPEGGIWNPGDMPARTGVALLSGRSRASVVPVGFGGMLGSLNKVLKLQQPELTMNIGQVLAPVQIKQKSKSYKEALQEGSDLVMRKIRELIPSEDESLKRSPLQETFELQVKFLSSSNGKKTCQWNLSTFQEKALVKFLTHPVIMDVFVRNLKLRVQSLLRLDEVHDPQMIGAACQEVLGYLRTNPGFLTYRFGMEEGVAMQAGLAALEDFCSCAVKQQAQVKLDLIHRQVNAAGLEVVRKRAESPHLM